MNSIGIVGRHRLNMRLADFVEINPRQRIERGTEYPCVMMDDVTPGRRYVTAPSHAIYKSGSVFQSGDTLFARITPCLENGKIAQFKDSENQIGIGSTEFVVMRAREGISDEGYVYYLAASDLIRKPAEKSMFGASGRQRADINVIREIEINPPELDTQRRIASILSCYDDLIENNTRRIQILEEMARMIYREWFIEKRFPNHAQYANGELPEGWQEKKLGEIADINARSIKKDSIPQEIHYVDIASVSTGHIDKIETMQFQNAPGRARRIVQHGDIIWSTVRPNRKSYSLILNPPRDLVVSTGFAVLSARDVPHTFLYHFVTTDEFVAYLTNRAKGSAYPAVSTEDFQDALLFVPTSELLKSFHDITNDLHLMIQTLRDKNSNLRRTRDLLLPKLVSGEIDVSEWQVGVE